jgi:hypothetical protein
VALSYFSYNHTVILTIEVSSFATEKMLLYVCTCALVGLRLRTKITSFGKSCLLVATISHDSMAKCKKEKHMMYSTLSKPLALGGY